MRDCKRPKYEVAISRPVRRDHQWAARARVIESASRSLRLVRLFWVSFNFFCFYSKILFFFIYQKFLFFSINFSFFPKKSVMFQIFCSFSFSKSSLKFILKFYVRKMFQWFARDKFTFRFGLRFRLLLQQHQPRMITPPKPLLQNHHF